MGWTLRDPALIVYLNQGEARARQRAIGLVERLVNSPTVCLPLPLNLAALLCLR